MTTYSTSMPGDAYMRTYVYLIVAGSDNGPVARYVKLTVAHAPGVPGTFSPPPRVSDPDMH